MPHPRHQLGAHPRTGDNQPAWWCEGGPGHDICCIGLFKPPRRGPGPAVTLVSGARTKGCGNSQTDVDHHVSDHPRATGTGMADRLRQQPVMRPNRRPDTHATCTTTLRAEPALMRRLNPPRFATGKPPTARWCRVGDLAAAEVDQTAGRMLRPHLPAPNDHVHLCIKMRRRIALNSGTRPPTAAGQLARIAKRPAAYARHR
jgi:hypothetical protein